MPWYPCRFPVCGTERSGPLKVGADAPRFDARSHLVPAQDRPAMVKVMAAPGFPVTGAGAYANRLKD